jgi:hypothetical protein
MITQPQLDAYVGKSIAQICPNGFVASADNHAAHFVGHALGFNSGMTCQIMGHGTGPGATLRIQDIFPRCPTVGVWSLRPSSLTAGLVFVTAVSNVNLAARVIKIGPRQHVGIFSGGFIWHYSNREQKVVKQTPTQFAQHYPPPDNAMFYGTMA